MIPWLLVPPKCQEKHFAVIIYAAIVLNFGSRGKDNYDANLLYNHPGMTHYLW